ncbi:MAG TPA: hypothetical protein VNJ51_14290 [Candidatus Dormibacteraeota bacterium]|nr:hypothetical protein [Candidatus Dormibacteraeota bacterium]
MMGCYYHNAVPAAGECSGCHQPLCATCLAEGPLCGGCRLAQRIERDGEPRLAGSARWNPPPPPPSAAKASVTLVGSPEGRALAAVGFVPFLWPAAVLALITPVGRDHYVRRQSLQAIGFNLAMAAIWIAFHAVALVPLLGWTLWGTLPFLLPIWLIASLVYAVKTWNGDDVRVPVIGEYVDRIAPAS